MRKPLYLSPTSIAKWRADRKEFFFTYLAENRPPRLEQTKPMSVGSSFDAYVKAYLMRRLFGGEDQFESLFEQQVDSHNQEWAREAGLQAFILYKESGALADLCLELDAASTEPRFEFKVQGNVNHESLVDGVPFLGRPDLYFTIVNPDGSVSHVIIDWKVNGWCAKRAPSPVKGYLNCRTWKHGLDKKYVQNQCAADDVINLALGTWSNKAHPQATAMMSGGLMIDVGHKMEDLNLGWATQETIYAWVLGVPVGEEFICGIDQLVGRNRVSSIRNRVSATFQTNLLDEAANIWTRIKLGAIFDEDNAEKIKMLSEYQEAYERDTNPHKDWLESILRKQ